MNKEQKEKHNLRMKLRIKHKRILFGDNRNKEYQKEYHKKWRERNKDKIKEHRIDNKEYHNNYNKEYRKKNPEYHKEYNKEWRKKNPEYDKKYCKDHPETLDRKIKRLINQRRYDKSRNKNPKRIDRFEKFLESKGLGKTKKIKEFYKKVCMNCGFDKTIDVHHINKDEVILLCPNCHTLHHREDLDISHIKSINLKSPLSPQTPLTPLQKKKIIS